MEREEIGPKLVVVDRPRRSLAGRFNERTQRWKYGAGS
jgi:hypothetical protein